MKTVCPKCGEAKVMWSVGKRTVEVEVWHDGTAPYVHVEEGSIEEEALAWAEQNPPTRCTNEACKYKFKEAAA